MNNTNNTELVEQWNFYYPENTSVQLTNDDGKVEFTKTRSIAWLLGSGHPVVKVVGRTGGYSLYRIRPTRAFHPEHICKGVYPSNVKEVAICGSCGQTFSCVLKFIGMNGFERSESYDEYVRKRESHAHVCPNFDGMGVNWFADSPNHCPKCGAWEATSDGKTIKCLKCSYEIEGVSWP